MPERALRALLPVGVGTGMALAGPHPLLPGEAIAATPARLADYAGGRAAARAAMAALGLAPVAIPMGADRAPVWPAGIAGSITHSGGVCLAVAAKGGMLGLDLEEDRPLDPDAADIILLPEERTTIGASLDLATLIFSAKEAVYKAQYPLTRTLFGFDSLAVTLTPGGFRARFCSRIGCIPEGAVIHGRQTRVAGRILSVVYAGSGLRMADAASSTSGRKPSVPASISAKN